MNIGKAVPSNADEDIASTDSGNDGHLTSHPPERDRASSGRDVRLEQSTTVVGGCHRGVVLDGRTIESRHLPVGPAPAPRIRQPNRLARCAADVRSCGTRERVPCGHLFHQQGHDQSAGNCKVQGRWAHFQLNPRHPSRPHRPRERLPLRAVSNARKSPATDSIRSSSSQDCRFDRPTVKFFSLGMQMRWASPSPPPGPDILLVDEFFVASKLPDKVHRADRRGRRQAPRSIYVSHISHRSRPPAQRRFGCGCRGAGEGPTRQVRLSIVRPSKTTPRWQPPTTYRPTAQGGHHRPGGRPVLSLEDAEVKMTINSPESVEADVFVGVSLGTASQCSLPSTMCLSVRRLRSNVPTSQHPAARGHYSVWAAMTGFASGATRLTPWKRSIL